MHSQNATHTIVQEVLANVSIPVAGSGRHGMMGGGGGMIPPALLEESRVPRFYQEAIVACGATTSSPLPHTALVYNMMVTSGLPRPVLSYIWSAVNRTLPGQLTRAEFFSCLALIALAQKSESLAALSALSQLPIPFLQNVQVPVQQPPVVVVSGQGHQQPPPQKPKQSSFIPISLLRRKPAVETKDPVVGEPKVQGPQGVTDLLGEATSSATTSAVTTSATTSGASNVPETPAAAAPNYDLSGIDWGTVGSSFTASSSSGSLSALAEPERKISNGDSTLINWTEAINAATALFKECDALLQGSSDAVLREVFGTERGMMYLKNLFSLSCVVERVAVASSTREKSDLDKDIAYCERVWRKFGIYFDRDERDPVEYGISNAVCPVCHSPISCSRVEFAGRSYHAECANLWVNCVRPVLP